MATETGAAGVEDLAREAFGLYWKRGKWPDREKDWDNVLPYARETWVLIAQAVAAAATAPLAAENAILRGALCSIWKLPTGHWAREDQDVVVAMLLLITAMQRVAESALTPTPTEETLGDAL